MINKRELENHHEFSNVSYQTGKKNSRLLSERLGSQLGAPLKPLNILVVCCTGDFRGHLIGPPWCRETLVSRMDVAFLVNLNWIWFYWKYSFCFCKTKGNYDKLQSSSPLNSTYIAEIFSLKGHPHVSWMPLRFVAGITTNAEVFPIQIQKSIITQVEYHKLK